MAHFLAAETLIWACAWLDDIGGGRFSRNVKVATIQEPLCITFIGKVRRHRERVLLAAEA